MKILIITFTSGNNPGTFMQGLGVQTAMKRLYPTAQIDFLKFPDFKVNLGVRDKKAKLWQTFRQKAASAYRLVKYNELRKKEMNFTPTIDLFNYTKEDESVICQYDLVVIGSDTILEEAYGKDGRIGLNWMPLDVRKLYFAASASPANFVPKNELKEVASKAVFIGLRDNLTIDFFVNKLGIEKERTFKQTDPSYFLDIKQFKLRKKLTVKLRTDQKYALYNFNSNFPLRRELADAIRNVGYKVVSTAYNPYADICFDMVDAYEWAGVFPLMDVIVTERFHDCVFGLRNCKPVIAIDWDPNRFAKCGDSKTKRIMEDYGLSHLHHNLYNNTDITPVIDSLKNIDQCYDKASLALLNDQIYANANRILENIGTILNNN